ncbi:hypothetical protein SEA_GODONK_198 [Gordonia phage GodonK]|uniref:Uncharacterized protein n=1 Tax=Gordonia phage GodonK TaxID=2562192 RepID=A0A4D6E2F3_9CAUD|nr:hypothetical protein HOV33_gp170 [Gordonia phage GodonK]QBZ72786.1 hypothetical protein SEA_GODONK_198 [Gordonia phage GodonK]
MTIFTSKYQLKFGLVAICYYRDPNAVIAEKQSKQDKYLDYWNKCLKENSGEETLDN